jgi:signal transduction histidine kinase/ligand-binding sensor domain-containing protein
MGYLWIGTKDGLNRFDGRSFKTYRNIIGDNSSISNNYILKIFQDKDSMLWIGTRGGGLCRFNRKTDSFTTFPYDADNNESLSHPEVLCLYEDNDGILWVGTDGGGLNQLNKSTGKFKRFNNVNDGSLSSLKILSITGYDAENLLLATWDGGLNIFNKKSGKCKIILSEAGKLSSNNIWLVQKEENKGFWIGHFERGLQFMHSNGEFTSIDIPGTPVVSVYSVVKQSPEKIFIASSSGIFITRIFFNNRNLRYEPLSMLNNFFSLQLTISGNNSIWASNFDNGLMHVQLSDPQFKITEFSSLPLKINYLNLFVNSFEEDEDGNILVGTSQGACIYSVKKNTVNYLEDTSKSAILRINVLKKNEANEIYAGKSLYLARYNPDLNQFEFSFKIPKSLNPYERDGYYDLLFESDQMWLATENGLYRKNMVTGSIVPVIRNNEKHNGYNIYQVRSVDSDNENIYAATLGGGLVVIHKESGKIKIFQHERGNPASLSSNQINQVYVSEKEQVWLVTFNGLCYFDKKEEKFRHFGIKDGFQAEFMTAIAEDFNGNLWISSQHGISKYNPQIQKVENFYFYSQLSVKSFHVKSAFTGRNGIIYFGRRGGFVSFHPDSIRLNATPPPVLITGFKVNNSEVVISPASVLKTNIEATKSIQLSYQQNSFAFSFAAMDFAFPERNKYAYMLENFDNDWVYTNDVNTSYTNVPPGKYVFRVKAANHDGIWNEEGVALQVHIRPAFWQTLVFKILVFLGIALLLLIGYNRRVYKIKKDKKELENLVALKTVELSKTNKILEEQNEELKAHKDELQYQRDTLKSTNQLLEDKKHEVEKTNKELEMHRENLEKLVQERTSELNIAKEKAEESDRLKTSFLANLSHEIRTPLNAIVGFSALLNERDVPTEKRSSYHHIIQSSSESLLILIDDIINLAKIETDQLEISLQYFSLNDLISELHLLFSRKFVENNIELRISPHVTGLNLFAYSDNTRVKQVLINFLSNALKFTEKGFVEIGYSIRENRELDIYVKDTGIGIQPENFRLIFERFMKLEQDDKLYRGAGLGLAICKKIAELLHARIWLESEYGKGSTFVLTLSGFTEEAALPKS